MPFVSRLRRFPHVIEQSFGYIGLVASGVRAVRSPGRGRFPARLPGGVREAPENVGGTP
jgi:hypothetical protein